MNKIYMILTIGVVANINFTNFSHARMTEMKGNIYEIKEDVYDSKTAHGLNLVKADDYLKEDRANGIGKSPFNTFSLFRTAIDKASSADDPNTRSLLKSLVKEEGEKVREIFKLSEDQISAIPGTAEEKIWRNTAQGSPVLLAIVRGEIPEGLNGKKALRVKNWVDSNESFGLSTLYETSKEKKPTEKRKASADDPSTRSLLKNFVKEEGKKINEFYDLTEYESYTTPRTVEKKVWRSTDQDSPGLLKIVTGKILEGFKRIFYT